MGLFSSLRLKSRHNFALPQLLALKKKTKKHKELILAHINSIEIGDRNEEPEQYFTEM